MNPNGLAVKGHSGTLNDMTGPNAPRNSLTKEPENSLTQTHLPKEPGSQENSSKNFRIRSDDPSTKDTFNSKPLCVCRRDTSLPDILVYSTFSTHADTTLTELTGTFLCRRPWCRSCDIPERTETVTSTNRNVRLKRRHDCTADGVVYVNARQLCYNL